jgi:hypothetical protein
LDGRFDESKMSIEEKYKFLSKLAIARAKITRCEGVAYLEDEEDKIFWKQVFEQFGHQLHYVFYSKIDKNDRTGVQQSLNYKKYACLSRDFFICIDSDFRYLDNEKGLSISDFVFQTYTYSFENHLCYGTGINQQMEKWIGFKQNMFDFKQFFEEYSKVVFPFFLKFFANRNQIKLSEFHKVIEIRTESTFPDISMNGATELKLIEKKNFRPEIEFANETIQKQLSAKGVGTHNAYLFLQGHFIKHIITHFGKKVKKELEKLKKQELVEKEEIVAFFKENPRFEDILEKNIAFGEYTEIQKIEEDIKKFFSKN